MYTGLMHSHRALGWLLIVVTTFSVLLSLLAATGAAGPKVTRVATILARFVETSMFGLLGVTGLAMWVVGGWPIGTWWMWAGVGSVVLAGVVSARGVKPALVATSQDPDNAMRWVAWAGLHWAIAVAVFSVMYAR